RPQFASLSLTPNRQLLASNLPFLIDTLRNQNCRNCFPLKGRITSNRHKFDGCSSAQTEQRANKTLARRILGGSALPACLPVSVPPSPSQSLPHPCVTIPARTMAKLRISIVEYLNTAPLVWG